MLLAGSGRLELPKPAKVGAKENEDGYYQIPILQLF